MCNHAYSHGSIFSVSLLVKDLAGDPFGKACIALIVL